MKDIHTFVILAYLENDNLLECVKSVLNQTVKSNVIIATSTKNDYIIDLASEYGLGVMVNDNTSNKGSDYNYALNAFDTEIVTIAHQDDIYDRNYVKEIMNYYNKNKDASIIITDSYEVLGDKKLKRSRSLLKKNFLIKPLKYKKFQNKKYFKLRSLKYNQSFCTSTVTYIKKNIKNDFFPTDLTYNNDWQAFIELAKTDSRFVLIDKKLVGHRIKLNEVNDVKIKEDILIYKSLWPNFIIDYIYKKEKKDKKSRVIKNKNILKRRSKEEQKEEKSKKKFLFKKGKNNSEDSNRLKDKKKIKNKEKDSKKKKVKNKKKDNDKKDNRINVFFKTKILKIREFVGSKYSKIKTLISTKFIKIKELKCFKRTKDEEK